MHSKSKAIRGRKQWGKGTQMDSTMRRNFICFCQITSPPWPFWFPASGCLAPPAAAAEADNKELRRGRATEDIELPTLWRLPCSTLAVVVTELIDERLLRPATFPVSAAIMHGSAAVPRWPMPARTCAARWRANAATDNPFLVALGRADKIVRPPERVAIWLPCWFCCSCWRCSCRRRCSRIVGNLKRKDFR